MRKNRSDIKCPKCGSHTGPHKYSGIRYKCEECGFIFDHTLESTDLILKGTDPLKVLSEEIPVLPPSVLADNPDAEYMAKFSLGADQSSRVRRQDWILVEILDSKGNRVDVVRLKPKELHYVHKFTSEELRDLSNLETVTIWITSDELEDIQDWGM